MYYKTNKGFLIKNFYNSFMVKLSPLTIKQTKEDSNNLLPKAVVNRQATGLNVHTCIVISGVWLLKGNR